MTDQELLSAIAELIRKFALSDEEVAALCGCSWPVARRMRFGKDVPRRQTSRLAVERFVQRAREARYRSDLRLP